MTTIPIIHDYRPLLRTCFSADQALIDHWHICAGQGFEACVERTAADLSAANVRVTSVHEDERLVGYFGKEVLQQAQFLTGFFLMPDFRTPASRAAFWKLVEAALPGRFACGLYTKNEPANRFIRSRGGIAVDHGNFQGHDFIFYGLGA